MTLSEMSVLYADSAAAIHARIIELRDQEKLQTDAEAARRLRQRIETLAPLWWEMRELSALTANYYDRSYHRHERYSI